MWQYIFNSPASLLSLSKKKLKETNPELYKARNLNLKLKIIEKITARDCYKYIIGIIVGLASLCFINYDFFNCGILSNLNCFILDKDLVDKLIDNRINNIVTITSISLVVVGFLINNIKEKNKETYELLFTETKLYPIVYFILIVISLLLIVSFLRDTMCEYQYINFIILAMCLILVVIICIGFLFSKIILFTNSQYLYNLFSKNLIYSAKQILYREKISLISKEILTEKLSKYGIIVTTPFGSRHPNRINIISTNAMTVKDINIKKIESCLKNIHSKKIHENLDFYPISIYENIYPNLERTFIYTSENVFQINTLQQAVKDYVYLAPKENLLNFEEIKESLFEKSKEAIDSNDSKTLKQIISNYNTLYELYFINFKK